MIYVIEDWEPVRYRENETDLRFAWGWMANGWAQPKGDSYLYFSRRSRPTSSMRQQPVSDQELRNASSILNAVYGLGC